jgi:hypothetical protein
LSIDVVGLPGPAAQMHYECLFQDHGPPLDEEANAAVDDAVKVIGKHYFLHGKNLKESIAATRRYKRGEIYWHDLCLYYAFWFGVYFFKGVVILIVVASVKTILMW